MITTKLGHLVTNAFIKHIHNILYEGYVRMKNKHVYNTTSVENEITWLLYNEMDGYLNDRSCPNIYKNYFVSQQDPTRSTVQGNTVNGIIDIQFECSSKKPRPHLTFEAKRLRKPDFTIGDYINEGLVRFISGKYADDHRVAGMLGYMQSDDDAYWFMMLAHTLMVRHDLNMQGNLDKINLHPNIDTEYVSKHTRSALDDIYILHIYLDCT